MTHTFERVSNTRRAMREWTQGAPSKASVPNLLLYHHLTVSDLPIVRRAIGNGVDVACLTADAAVREEALEGVRVLGASALPYHWDVFETRAVIDLVEVVFDVLARQSDILRWLRQVYGSPDIDYYFRRTLVNELGQLLCVAFLATDPSMASYESITVAPGWPASSGLPLFLGLWHRDDTRRQLAAHLSQPICAAFDRLAVTGEQGIAGMGKYCARALYYVVRTWYLALRCLRPYASPLPTCHLLLRTFATDLNIDSGEQHRLRNMDFVVDGKELRTEDVAFWAEPGTSKERRENLKQRGYHVLNACDVVISPIVFARRVLPLLLSYTGLVPKLIREARWWYPHVAALVYYYLIWQEVCHQVKPAAFVAHNDIWPKGVARNVVLRQHGCFSVLYQHSSNRLIAKDGNWAIEPIVPLYLVFDAIANWGSDFSDLFRRHPGAIGDYWEVGCLWSEHARLVKEDPKVRKNYVDQIESHAGLRLSNFQRIVGVFDTALSSMLSHNDMYSFVAGTLELASRMPEVLFLYKPKYPFAEAEPEEKMPLIEVWGAKGRKLWDKISTTPNFVVLPRLFETASVVGLADLVISACFTSTTVEAIGCGQRAIYYDPTDRLPHAFWRRIPGMVCVTEEELYNQVRYLLWDCDEETYANYLRTHCMGIEGHFDGQAITRLRSRILDVVNGRQPVTGIDS